MTSEAEGDYFLEACSEVVCTGNVAYGLDDGGEPGQNVAGEVPPGVELRRRVQQEDQVCRNIANQVTLQKRSEWNRKSKALHLMRIKIGRAHV